MFFKNKNVAVTGILRETRNEVADRIRLAGGRFVTTVSGSTDYLIIGDNPGEVKLSAATMHSVAHLTDAQFYFALRNGALAAKPKPKTKMGAWTQWTKSERRRFITPSIFEREVYRGSTLILKNKTKNIRSYSRALVPYDGEHTEWYPNGQLKVKGSFNNVLMNGWNPTAGYTPIGLHQSWHPDGTLRSVETYDAQGRRNGKFAEYTPSGLERVVRYFVNDVRIPSFVFTSPEKIQPEDVLAEKNAEVRRVMLEKLGYDVFLARCGTRATIVDEQKDSRVGTLIRIDAKGDSPGSKNKDDVIMLLKVKDGTLPKHYVLRVPPTMKTARQANAWTWGLKEHEYAPSKET